MLKNNNAALDIAALAYAKGGIYINDATISSFKTKCTYNVERPITYIRNVMGQSNWNPLFATPAHPDYSSAHMVQSTAVADALTSIFGTNYKFADHQFDNAGWRPGRVIRLMMWSTRWPKQESMQAFTQEWRVKRDWSKGKK